VNATAPVEPLIITAMLDALGAVAVFATATMSSKCAPTRRPWR
jgi:hypothetical protein